MDRLEMARKLFVNPKLKAFNNYGGTVCVELGNGSEYTKSDKCLKWTNERYVDMCIIEGESWEIIEPKLKEFCYGEMYYMFTKNSIDCGKIKSCLTGRDFNREDFELTRDEYVNKWTIEGYYEGE